MGATTPPPSELTGEQGRRSSASLSGASERWFSTLVANSSDLILVVDAEARQIYASPACNRILGYAVGDAADLLAHVHPDDLGSLRQRLAAVTDPSAQPSAFSFRCVTVDGTWRTLEAVATDCLEDPAIAGVVINARDVTESRVAESALRRSETSLRGAERIAHIGHWEYDVAQDLLEWFADEIYRIHAVEPGRAPKGGAAYVALVLEEDRPKVSAAVHEALSAGRCSIEYRIVLSDGRIRTLRCESELVIDGPHQRIVGTCQDISEQSQTRRALQERVKELSALATINGGAHRITDRAELCELAARSLRSAMQDPDRGSVEVVLEDQSFHVGTSLSGACRYTSPITNGGVERGRVRIETDSTGDLVPEEMALADAVAQTLGLWLDRDRATGALRQANAELNQAITELNQANTELAASTQLKDDLLSMTSHELRTPLTPILGFLDLLEGRGDNLTADQRRMLQIMRRNARRLLHLVDDLLVVNHANAGVLVAEPEETVAQTTLMAVVAELGATLPDVEVSLEGCRVFVDPRHLQQIVVNLLSNATKYGALPITLTAASAGEGRVVLEVADQGPGVPSDFQGRMWERFVQKDRGDTRTATGTGLGLTIVKLLTEANGGAVGYRDGSPAGAVFTVELPGVIERRPRSGGGHSNGRGEFAPVVGSATRLPGAAGWLATPRPAMTVAPEADLRGSPVSTAVLVPPPPGVHANGEAVDVDAVMAWATRQLLHVESRDDAAGVVLRVVQRLGGWTTPAQLADEHALPLDVSFGISDPVLPVAPPHSIERLLLERHLPMLVEDARRAVDQLSNVSQLQHEATSDPLTGLANPRSIRRLLARGCEGAAVVMIDLDGFKAVNDRYGHAVGDRLLRHFATCLREKVRATDHCGRVGGDEFILVLPDTDEVEAGHLVARLAREWEDVRTHEVGFSAGVAVVGTDVAEAVERADAAMYADKAARQRWSGSGRQVRGDDQELVRRREPPHHQPRERGHAAGGLPGTVGRG